MILRRFWRNRPAAAGLPVALALMAAVLSAACDKVALTAPTDSTISLFADAASVPVNGTIQITASVTESAGTPVQNGTVVTFTTTLGRLDPVEARTNNGKVTVRLAGDGRSGTASITAFSGGNKSDALEIPVGAAAAGSIVVRANPNSLGSGGGTVQLTATVRDIGGGPLAGVLVTFSATAGRLGASSAITNENGDAQTTLTTTQQSEVTVEAGGTSPGQNGGGGGTTSVTASTTVLVSTAPTIQVTVAPEQPAQGQPTTFSITVTPPSDGAAVQSMSIDFGDGETRQLGANSTTVQHIYDDDGTFTVTIRVRDTSGGESTQVTIIAVLPASPIPVSITVDTETATVNSPVNFTVEATPPTGVTIQKYTWDFGDGSPPQSTTGPAISHIFKFARSFTVTVTVEGSDGSEGNGQTAVSVQ
jgi:hypothetical protein